MITSTGIFVSTGTDKAYFYNQQPSDILIELY